MTNYQLKVTFKISLWCALSQTNYALFMKRGDAANRTEQQKAFRLHICKQAKPLLIDETRFSISWSEWEPNRTDRPTKKKINERRKPDLQQIIYIIVWVQNWMGASFMRLSIVVRYRLLTFVQHDLLTNLNYLVLFSMFSLHFSFSFWLLLLLLRSISS